MENTIYTGYERNVYTIDWNRPELFTPTADQEWEQLKNKGDWGSRIDAEIKAARYIVEGDTSDFSWRNPLSAYETIAAHRVGLPSPFDQDAISDMSDEQENEYWDIMCSETADLAKIIATADIKREQERNA